LESKLSKEGSVNKEEYQKLKSNGLNLKMREIGLLFEDFTYQRKNAILMKHVPINVSPETLITKLNLDMRSIR
jgi:hypothetical protein